MAEDTQTVTILLRQFNHMCDELLELREYKKNSTNMLDKIRTEIGKKIEQDEFARSVFRHEEKDTFKAEQCTGSIMAYNNVIKLIDKYKAESEDAE